MSEVANLTSLETADRILSILKEYSDKLAALEVEASAKLLNLLGHPNSIQYGIDAAKLVCIFNTIDRPVKQITQHASGLLEHSDFEHVIWWELKLRLNEIELYYQLCKSNMERIRVAIEAMTNTELQHVKRYIEVATGQKPPF